MMQRVIVNCASPGDGDRRPPVQLVTLTPAEVEEHQASQAAEAAREQEEAARRADLESRRGTLAAELAAIRDATGWAAARGPLVRLLVFVLRRLGERDA